MTVPHHSEPAREAVALLPCPFCGCAPNPVPQNDDCPLPDGSGRYHQTIWCENCGAEGGKRRTGEDAIQAWSRRAPPAPAAGGLGGGLMRMVAHHRKLLADPDNYRVLDRAVHQHLVDTIAAIASPAAGGLEAVRAIERIEQRICVWSEKRPDTATDDEPEETWESWYGAAFGMLLDEVKDIRAGIVSGGGASERKHVTRMSDSSHYDEVCTVCGATDAMHGGTLHLPCPGASVSASPAATSAETQGGAVETVAGILKMRDEALFTGDAFEADDDERRETVAMILAALAPSTSAATRGDAMQPAIDAFAENAEIAERIFAPAPAVESAQVKVKPLEWSEPAPPNGKDCFYDHVRAETSLGHFSIEWKSWKAGDSYAVMFDGDFLSAEPDLVSAKAFAFSWLLTRIRASLDLATDAEG